MGKVARLMVLSFSKVKLSMGRPVYRHAQRVRTAPHEGGGTKLMGSTSSRTKIALRAASKAFLRTTL
jgi:hypothetical protein